MDIRLRLPSKDGIDRTRTIRIDSNETVENLKQRIRHQILSKDVARGHRIRLLHRGKSLQDEDKIVSIVKHLDYVLCALSPIKDASESSSAPIDEEIDDPSDSGFRSLQRHGFDEDDIESLRSLFSLEVREASNRAPRIEGETDAQRRRRIERAWVREHVQRFVDATGRRARSGGGDELLGSRAEFAMGLALGLFLGMIMLFWAADSSIPRSRRMGIVCGVAANVGWGVWSDIPDADSLGVPT